MRNICIADLISGARTEYKLFDWYLTWKTLLNEGEVNLQKVG